VANFVSGSKTVHHGHGNIQQDEIRFQLFDLVKRLLTVFSFVANVDEIAKNRAGSPPHQFLIIDD